MIDERRGELLAPDRRLSDWKHWRWAGARARGRRVGVLACWFVCGSAANSCFVAFGS